MEPAGPSTASSAVLLSPMKAASIIDISVGAAYMPNAGMAN